MKITITGSEGSIGSRLLNLGCEPLSCDVTNRVEVEEELRRTTPDVVIHLAAATSVDWCEEHYEEACAVNVYGTNTVCEVAEEVVGSGKVILLSSDMVFDGQKGFYSEEDEPNPINNYGLTKLAAEGIASLYGDKIIRISRCFDSKSKDVSEYINKLKRHEEIFVPVFMSRSYCHLDYISEAIFQYANRFEEMPEILNIAGDAYPVSFYELMRWVAIQIGETPFLVKERGPIDGFSPRPYKTGLSVYKSKKLGISIYNMDDSVARLISEIK